MDVYVFVCNPCIYTHAHNYILTDQMQILTTCAVPISSVYI